ncbi:plastocyanin/azurin family copper-binding protein [Phenylobacterium sp. LjRoot225]|uniref:cupredoxin domain-containing protein n=1 Tax=Phenylobacterium sp. LjRoot225 TaxID=3342285 RepID=UPI003ED0BD7E
MKIRILSGLAAALVISGVCWAATIAVDQKDIAFSLSRLVVKRGDSVTFTNSDPTSHNLLITGSGLTVDSGLQKPGVAFKAPFMKSGTYQVTCAIHPKMMMTVVVQ